MAEQGFNAAHTLPCPDRGLGRGGNGKCWGARGQDMLSMGSMRVGRELQGAINLRHS